MHPTSRRDHPAPQGGAIGKNFTTELRECLTHVSSLKPEEVHEQYGYPVLRMADAVRNRSIGEGLAGRSAATLRAAQGTRA